MGSVALATHHRSSARLGRRRSRLGIEVPVQPEHLSITFGRAYQASIRRMWPSGRRQHGSAQNAGLVHDYSNAPALRNREIEIETLIVAPISQVCMRRTEDLPLFHNTTKYIPALLDTVQGV